jgi:protein-arginine kinase activator protein McsA
MRATTPTPRCSQQVLTQTEGEHQLEKLQFALAVALTRGDQHRSAQLRDQIAALGGNLEEPGT